MNYTVYHLHSDLSTCVTSVDSVTKYNQYVDRAKECGMSAMAFSEHGSVFEWVKKKETIEKAGMKYIHAEEFYVTETLTEKIKDNCHVVIIAMNYDGVLELNKLSSKAFNRNDNHYYYVPRISMEELEQTSDNLMITSACLASPLSKGNDAFKKRFLKFLIANQDRCYLEIQHHDVEEQRQYNKYLWDISKKYGIPLIAGTDTHALNAEHAEARLVLQKAKNIYFSDEEKWDLVFKTYEELIDAYVKQDSLPMDVVLEAIENTNRMADRVEEFTLDRSYKYPHLWDNPKATFIQKIKEGIKRRGVDKYPNRDKYAERVKYEIKAYEHNGAFDFMLLMEDIISWCHANDIPTGYGRGSVNGSVCAWLLGITEMDSIKHNLNFDRFMNVERVSLSDIDTDFPPNRIDEVKDYVFNHHGLYCSDIATFNTIADKGAIRDVVRGLYAPTKDVKSKLSPEMQKKYDEYYERIEGHDARDMDVSMPDEIKSAIDEVSGGDYMAITNDVLELFEKSEEKARQKYPEVFKYVDICKGVIVSMGNHPCGMVVSPHPIDDAMGLCTTSTDPFPISQIYMKEIDGLNYVKLDLLKLDTIQLIYDACRAANIDMLTPDNLDINDIDVWNSIRDNTVGIFQWEGATGDRYIKKLMSDKNIEKLSEFNKNLDRMTLLTIGNSAIRPAGASYRDDLANGVVRSSGNEAIDEFLKPTFGYLVFQCQIIEFLHQYCGFTMGEADVVRRMFAKKTGTESVLPVIKDGGYLNGNQAHYIDGFVKTMAEKYDMPKEEAEESIVAFLQVILDASDYLFSVNHSQPYSYEGYACGWLRYHYPLQFLTCALNICKDDTNKTDKTQALTQYARDNNIKILSPKFRFSLGEYSFSTEENAIYKGISSVTYMSERVAEELYALRNNNYCDFLDLLEDVEENTSADSRQVDILIKLDFFSEFGGINDLLDIKDKWEKYSGRKTVKKDSDMLRILGIDNVRAHSGKETDKQFSDINMSAILREWVLQRPHIETTIFDKIDYEVEYLGYAISTSENVKPDYWYVMSIDGYNKNVLSLYQICDGEVDKIKIDKNYKVKKGNVIHILEYTNRPRWRKVGEDPKTHKPKFEKMGETERMISKVSIIDRDIDINTDV